MAIRNPSASLPTSPTSRRRRWLHRCVVVVGLVALALASCLCLVGGLKPSLVDDPHVVSNGTSRTARGAEDCPEARYFLVGSGGLLAAWLVVGLVAFQSRAPPPAMTMLAILLCFVTVVAGIVGAILGGHEICAQSRPTEFTLTIATSCVFVAVCAPLMGILVHYVVRHVSSPDSKGSGLVGALRCTSIAHSTRRCLAILPFGMLAGVAVVLVLVYARRGEGCSEPFVLFLVVSSGLLGFILGVALWCYLHPHSSAAFLPYLLLGHAVTTVGWAIVGTVWIRSNAAAPVQCSVGLVSAVHWLRMPLFVLGIAQIMLTCCCKLERLCLPLVVPTDHTVQVV
ncbi:hypothetical protein H310_09255 [Aphanomyces invadans]|uniref:Uncharacterized protein n=1 Tax=Aphanomyces invadans TaxID=157072 RepID=A0A024TUV9_9STRA|nr:hypothetical protein H310_09255 [Aphanomyces invadans]ETV97940.1 hypothetical protein H310_09255 [Aphanomyces invadans]|eukprot:XP_008873501.1 hypothetical protein H310_09255 [Aphanomyces invadans]